MRLWPRVGVALVALIAGLSPLARSSVALADPLAPTPGAVNVRAFGATGDGSADDTAAFRAAMDASLRPDAVHFARGPGGDPQGVVYVPAGTYRLLNLTFPSNLRMEVDAGAVLEQAGGRDATAPPEYSSPTPSLVLWDGPPAQPLRNVTLIGVGSSTGGRKSVANPVAPGWSIDTSFTFDLDPAVTNANNTVTGVMAMNVRAFLISHVFSIQNDSQPATTPTDNAGWWPGTRKVAIMLRARSDTPTDGSAYYDPHSGTIVNWYNVHGPRGFGPNQVTSGHNLVLKNVFSQGGTALRLETDNAGTQFGSEIRTLRATNIDGMRCNRAVAFAPHKQNNSGVAVSDVSAIGCYQGVVEATDESSSTRGSFVDSTISGVKVVGGDGAQLPLAGGDGHWAIGGSYQAFSRDGVDPWAVIYSAGTYTCSGAFAVVSTPIQTTAGEQTPDCGGAPVTPPTGVVATPRSRSKIRVTWNAVGGVTGYRVSRATTSGGPYTAVIDTSKASFTDVQLRRSTTYYYVVQSLTGSTATAYSAEASATTLSS